MSNCNALGRMATTAGVEPVFIFRPAQLTTRMRNNVKTMVKDRMLRGTWASMSRRVSRHLLKHYGVPFAGSNGSMSMELPPLNAKTAQSLLQVCRADFAARILDICDNPHRAEVARQRMANSEETLHNNMSGTLYFFDPMQRKKAEAILVEYMQANADVYAERVDACLRMLDDPSAHITLSAHHAY